MRTDKQTDRQGEDKTLRHNDYVCSTAPGIEKIYILHKECSHVSLTILKTNGNYLPVEN